MRQGHETMDTNMIIARSLAPEDINVGMYVMTLHSQHQYLMLRDNAIGDDELYIQQIVRRPCEPELPRKVVGVCLPFVVVRNHNRKTEMLDTRSVRLARIDNQVAKIAIKPHLKPREAKSDGKRCKCCRSK